MRTPVNIAKFAIERTPLEFLNMVRRNDFKNLPDEAIDKLARATMGSLIGAGVYLYAKQGLITGSGPTDKAQRDQMYRRGWQPYSVKIGDTYYSYQRLEPLGSVIGLAADYAELSETMDENDIASIAGKVSLSISRNLISKTFMKGLYDLLNAIADPVQYAENWTESLVGTTVASIVSWAAKLKDPTLRNPQGAAEAIKAHIPGMSSSVLPKVDVWGRQIKTQGSAVFRALSPSKATRVVDDAVENEIAELGLVVHQPGKTIAGVSLDKGQYYGYQVLSGKLAKQRLDKLVAADDYRAASVIEKESMIQQTITKARQEVGYAALLPKLPGGNSIITMNTQVRELKAEAKKRDYKLTRDDSTALREWYLGEIDATLKQEVIPSAKGKSKAGWERFYEVWSQLQQIMVENDAAWDSEKMAKVRAWYNDEVRVTKADNPEFAKEFERYPAAAWAKY
ncbi:MAG TPA: hypothetical protein VGK02_06345 [Candidatus Aquicultor sp.]|jgi:hypothetical protein